MTKQHTKKTKRRIRSREGWQLNPLQLSALMLLTVAVLTYLDILRWS